MKKALHIDDSHTLYQIVSSAASVIEVEVLHASDGQTGLDILEEFCEDINLVILDFNLPGADGLQILKRIKADKKTGNIPVMMLTSDADPALVMDFIKAGAANYLNKPFTQEDLISRMMSCVGQATT
ncbi:MAG: response regulator [Verrucomicrobiota bacterium]